MVKYTLKNRIKKVRKSLGLSQDEFGAKIGVVKSAVANWENGRNAPSSELKKVICRVFDVSTLYLEGESDVMFTTPVNDEEIVDSLLNSGDKQVRALIIAIAKHPELAKYLCGFLSFADVFREHGVAIPTAPMDLESILCDLEANRK